MKTATKQNGIEKVELHLGDAPKRKGIVVYNQPFTVEVVLEGVTPILFHRFDCDEMEAKGAARKGSIEKKTDNLESFVYRVPETDELGFPSANLKQAIVQSAKFSQDPRSPRKSAMDIFKAGVKLTPEVASFGLKTWDYVDRRGVVINHSRVPRSRPSLKSGWKLTYFIQVILPEYISESFLHEVLARAGITIGIAELRPDYGTFRIVKFERV